MDTLLEFKDLMTGNWSKYLADSFHTDYDNTALYATKHVFKGFCSVLKDLMFVKSVMQSSGSFSGDLTPLFNIQNTLVRRVDLQFEFRVLGGYNCKNVPDQ